ncbi:hypothetical protein M595_4213 [Lyngbya aestuarii BL J]|uniref:Uncharacterized protein n=1 Tax=Lyngbya aestuarii BL J TaxID=1348334 RepID=U7QH95_9CYAN|nr:hypothetical protein M595_4213 [Lyngbya aestuarii BL J]
MNIERKASGIKPDQQVKWVVFCELFTQGSSVSFVNRLAIGSNYRYTSLK